MKYRVLSLAVLAAIIFSCASKSGSTTVSNETRPTAQAPVVATVMTPELAEGKELYNNNCAKCHRLYKPDEFSAEEWAPIVKRMAKKSHLNELQEQRIYNYITMK